MDERSLADDQDKASGLVHAGRQLAEARAAEGLSQAQLASQMHMGVEQLAALERGDQDELPEPVFIKAMVRRLSSHLGLDADAMVQNLGPLICARPARPAPGPTAPGHQPRKQTTRNALSVLALAGVAGLGVVVWSNASALSRFAQGLQPAPQTPEQSQPASLPEGKPDLDTAVVAIEPTEPIVPAQPSADVGFTISSSEPSWIALRREGIVEFEGILKGERKIEDPELVEIYAGRPDLVQLTLPDAEPKTLGAVNDIRWIPLSPER